MAKSTTEASPTAGGVSGTISPGPFIESHAFNALLIALFVGVLRALYLGDPAVNIDEQFYLVVADKWLNAGMLPYVDIWDRKPVGTFLIYMPAVLFFKNAVVGYQLLGMISTFATCFIVYRMGLWLAPFGAQQRRIALAAALFYGAILMLWSGAGGQTPVFYNLPIASGAFLIFRLLRGSGAGVRGCAAALFAASLLFGLALQIKYICVFEIVFLSLFALGSLFVARRISIGNALLLAAGMIVCGLAPTILASVYYLAIGHWQEFFFANFQSIFGKKVWRFSPGIYLLNVLSAVIYCVVFWVFAGIALTHDARAKARPLRSSMMIGLCGWLVFAVGGALSLGNPILHYFLPTAAPLALLSAAGLAVVADRNAAKSARRFYIGLGTTILASTVAAVIIFTQTTRLRGADQVYPIAAYINAHMNGHEASDCPYVFDDFPILYYLTQCKAPSIYTFPNHLTETAELHALTVDSLTELRRVFATKPAMIFVRRPFAPEFDSQAVAILEDTLRKHYALSRQFPGYRQEFDIYARDIAKDSEASPASR